MKTTKEIKARIKEVKADARFSYPCATVLENAPLALIQLELETQVDTLEWVLREKK